MQFFKKNKVMLLLLLPNLILVALCGVALWFYQGYGPPIQKNVLIEVGDSTAQGEIVMQKLSGSLYSNPSSSTFKVTTEGGFGGSRFASVLIYDRRNKTLDETNWLSDAGVGRYDQHYLYSGVTDNSIHNSVVGGRERPGFKDDDAMPTRKVLLEKFVKY